MAKYWIRILSFILIFILLFALVQEVLHYRWSGDEDLYTRNLNYMRQQENSIDVLYFGTSEIYAMCSPIVTYDEAGITGYNFAITKRSAITTYYQLLFALKYQTPEVVVCDFSGLYNPFMPSGGGDSVYRKVVECMPDKEVKKQLIRDICRIGTDQDYLSWKLPLLRYHSMWNELSEDNFKKDFVYNKEYPDYQKGALLDTEYTYSVEGFSSSDITEELWEAEPSDEVFSNISVEYYDKFISECTKRSIKCVAVFPPIPGSAKEFASRYPAIVEYLDSRGVECIDYDNYEQYMRMGLNLEEDYYDKNHLNYSGSIKASRVLAMDLKDMFDLQDRRLQPDIAEEWNSELEEFKIMVNNAEQ